MDVPGIRPFATAGEVALMSAEANYGIAYDPQTQLHVVERDGSLALAVDELWSSGLASTDLDTWCRDPHDSTSSVKDDKETTHND